MIYPNEKIQEICNDYSELFDSKDEVYRLIFGNYTSDNDVDKRPLAKLTIDLCRELNIID
jgi:hypothetical protein